jgi:hypothetical protein
MEIREILTILEGLESGVRVVDQDYDLDQIVLTLSVHGQKRQFAYTDYDENFDNAERGDVHDQLQRNDWYATLSHPDRMEILDAAYRAIRGLEPRSYQPTVGDEPMDVGDKLDEQEKDGDPVARVERLAREIRSR